MKSRLSLEEMMCKMIGFEMDVEAQDDVEEAAVHRIQTDPIKIDDGVEDVELEKTEVDLTRTEQVAG